MLFFLRLYFYLQLFTHQSFQLHLKFNIDRVLVLEIGAFNVAEKESFLFLMILSFCFCLIQFFFFSTIF